mmetsp:Transcript_2403/g.9294  ORF Transcript_2403/g.9294 Transcript_2403/m.9294 type:complete len:534 (+) Transcript_2403:2422-4023(+)
MRQPAPERAHPLCQTHRLEIKPREELLHRERPAPVPHVDRHLREHRVREPDRRAVLDRARAQDVAEFPPVVLRLADLRQAEIVRVRPIRGAAPGGEKDHRAGDVVASRVLRRPVVVRRRDDLLARRQGVPPVPLRRRHHLLVGHKLEHAVGGHHQTPRVLVQLVREELGIRRNPEPFTHGVPERPRERATRVRRAVAKDPRRIIRRLDGLVAKILAQRSLAEDHPQRREEHGLLRLLPHALALVPSEARLVVRHLDDVPGAGVTVHALARGAQDGSRVAHVAHVEHVLDDVRHDGGGAAALARVAEVLLDDEVGVDERAGVRGGARVEGHRRGPIAVRLELRIASVPLELAREGGGGDLRGVFPRGTVPVEHPDEHVLALSREPGLQDERVLVDVRFLVGVASLLAHHRALRVVKRQPQVDVPARLPPGRVHVDLIGLTRGRFARGPPLLVSPERRHRPRVFYPPLRPDSDPTLGHEAKKARVALCAPPLAVPLGFRRLVRPRGSVSLRAVPRATIEPRLEFDSTPARREPPD